MIDIHYMRFCTITLGCKANQFDTQTIEDILIRRGHTKVKPGEGCDVCVINTCAVTAESVRKSRQAVRRIKKHEPTAKVAICGCFSELEPETVAAIGCDLIGGTDDREAFALEVEKLAENDGMHTTNTLPIVSCDANFRKEQSRRTRALLKIQDGCDNYCAYCVIPFVRGRSRSVPPGDILRQAKHFEAQGFKEIVITGIELSSWKDEQKANSNLKLPVDRQLLSEPSYAHMPHPAPNERTPPSVVTLTECSDSNSLPTARDAPAKHPLPALLQAISGQATNARLRIGSLDPAILTDEFIEELKKIPKLCNHIHLSLQSGCEETLQRMGRKYNLDAVSRSIIKLRECFPDCGITADLIVGFPGETDEEFAKTLKFIEDAAFSDMHIFSFSPRPKTAAADMPNQIDKQTRKKRSAIATAVAKKMAQEFKETQLGKCAEVIFEQEKDGFMVGYSSNYLEVAVKIQSDKSDDNAAVSQCAPAKNSLHKVKLKCLENGCITGKL